ncbi:MAG: hypothetical protein V2A58_09820, partial [Planctomycetota bacterium]
MRCVVVQAFLVILALTIRGADAAEEESRLLESFRQIVEKEPLDGPTFVRMCELAEKGEGLVALEEQYRKRGQEEPRNDVIPVILGHLSSYREDPAEALRWYREAARRNPRSWFASYYEAKVLAELSRGGEALETLRRGMPLAAGGRRSRMHLTLMASTAAALRDADATRDAVRRLLSLEGADVFAHRDAAGYYEEAGLVDEAIEEHRRIVELSRSDPYQAVRSLLAVAQLSRDARRPEAAEQALEEAKWLVSPDNPMRSTIVREEAGLFRAEDRMGDLLGRYGKHLSENPLDLQSRVEYARLLREEGDLARALEEYDSCVRVSRGSRAMLKEAGETALRAGDAKRLVRYAGMLEGGMSSTPEDFVAVAKWYERAGDPGRRAGAILSAQKSLGNDPRSLMRFSAELVSSGFVKEARDLLSALAGRNDLSAEVLVALADAQASAGDAPACAKTLEGVLSGNASRLDLVLDVARRAREDAFGELGAKAYTRAIELADSRWDILREAAKALSGTDEATAALPTWWKLAREGPTDELRNEAEDEIIQSHERSSSLAGLRDECARGLEASGDETSAILLGKLALRGGSPASAVEFFRDLARKNPKSPRAVRLLEGALAAEGSYAEAMECAERLLAMDPARARDHYQRAIDYGFARKDLAVTRKWVERLIASLPTDAEAHGLALAAFERLGDEGRALEEARKAVALSQGAARPLEALASLLERTGAFEEAAAVYERMFKKVAAGGGGFSVLAAARKLARLAVILDRVDRTDRLLRTSLRLHRGDLIYYEALAGFLAELARPQEASEVYASAFRAVEDRRALLELLARRGAELSGAGPPLDFALGLAHSDAGLAPDQAFIVADFLLRAGRVERARDVLEGGVANLEADEKLPAALGVAGLFLIREAPDEAVRWLEHARGEAPESPALEFALASAQERAGNRQAASRLFFDLFEKLLAPAALARFRAECVATSQGKPSFPGGSANALGLPEPTDEAQVLHAVMDRLVEAWEGGGQLEELGAQVEKGSAKPPEAYRLLETIYVRLRRNDGRLLRLYGEARERWPDDVLWLEKYAALAKNLGEDARAVEAYEELLVKRKDQAERYRTEILSIFLRSSDAEGL